MAWGNDPLVSEPMTLIRTVISNLGIIQASDSNLTSGAAWGNQAQAGQKVFKLDFTVGALALAGAYSVGKERMDTWMPAFIAKYGTCTRPTLGGFAKALMATLEPIIPKHRGCIYHIAGYVAEGVTWHPELWFVRNYTGIDESDGSYIGLGTWDVTEDFWSRDYLAPEAKQHFAQGNYRHYLNGAPPGRIAAVMLTPHLMSLEEYIWHRPGWQFRKWDTLAKLAAVIEAEFSLLSALYLSSGYPGPPIGGAVQMELIPPPSGTVSL